jgi:hypothetical protein
MTVRSMTKAMALVPFFLCIFACGSSAPCPVVPLHCACSGANPVCTNGQWVCPSSCSDGGSSADLSTGCTADDQCGANAYCKGLLNVCKNDCQLTIGTATTGTCHRSCVNQACACVDDSDCPGFYTSCDLPTQMCKSLAPPVCHSTCPTGCTDGTALQYGEVCICAMCP